MLETSTLSISIPRDALLDAVGQLSPTELSAFVDDILALKAKQAAPSLSQAESELLLKINATGLNANESTRLHELIGQSETGSLNESARKQYVMLSEKAELLNTQRLELIIQLAALRQQSVVNTIKQLGLSNPDASSAS